MMAACGGKVGGKPTLMVSIPPQKYVLERIAGDKWTVGSMIEKATSAESYDPDMSLRAVGCRQSKNRCRLVEGHFCD